MNPILAPEIERDPDLARKVRDATRLLEQQLGPAAERIRAEWSLASNDGGRPVVNLTISDWTGTVGYPFAPGELANPFHLQVRFHRLWGDFLQVRSHTQIDSEVGSPG